jgi:hypothetical protein
MDSTWLTHGLGKVQASYRQNSIFDYQSFIDSLIIKPPYHCESTGFFLPGEWYSEKNQPQRNRAYRDSRKLYQALFTEYDIYHTDITGRCVEPVTRKSVCTNPPVNCCIGTICRNDQEGLSVRCFCPGPDLEFPVSKKYYAGLLEKIRIIEPGSMENESDQKSR